MSHLPLVLALFACCLTSYTHAGTDCSDLKVQPINELPAAYLKGLDTKFYQKFVSGNGIPIMSSGDVTDYALKESARIIRGVTRDLKPGYVDQLIKKTERIAMWGPHETVCSLPEAAGPDCDPKFSGGMAWANILVLQQTSFDCDKRGNAWIGRVLVHEFSHGINSVFNKIDKTLQPELDAAYKNAKDKQIWPQGEYAMVSNAEYFAIGAQTWFEANEQRHCDMGACDRHELQKKDEQLYNIVARVFNEPTFLYKCAEFCNPTDNLGKKSLIVTEEMKNHYWENHFRFNRNKM